MGISGLGNIEAPIEGHDIGGGRASRRMDPLGKGLAQILLDMPVRVPAEWLG
ncbi:MAG: hypothetical protein WCT47_18805 [Betaproteobacteria bacterium]|jgi:hypothetical protein